MTAPWLLLSILFLSTGWTRAETAVQAWLQRYSHVTDANDYAQKLVTDNVGNVIVAGYTSDGITGSDMLVIKYSGGGVPLWTNRYNGPANSGDQANAVAVDSSGNVFVTGSSIGSGSFPDYLTIAYSGVGAPLWTNRYNGPGNGSDQARAVAVDASGNVFVTGSSIGSGSSPDYLTIAYSGGGVPLWTNRYNGPANSGDFAQALAVNGNGNVFVTGYSSGSGSSFDYATIAYSGAGAPLWTNRYNGPGNGSDQASAVAVDASGTVFVTGSSIGSGSSSDYLTIAYSGGGVPLWTNRYDGPANSGDFARALAVDGSGNVFVTGYSSGSGSSLDYATIAYSGGGAPLWTNRYNGPENGSDQASAVAVDASGTVFVTGNSSSGSSSDYLTIAYSSASVPLWTNRYDRPGNSIDGATAVAVDSSGNVIVTGSSDGSGGFDDYATIKYSGGGVPLWTNRYDGPGNSSGQANAVAVDGSGRVFVTGYSYGSGSGPDYATIAYSGAGVPLWTNRYNQEGSSTDEATALAVDGSGNVFVTGSSGVGGDYTTIAYSNSGVPLWTNRYNGPANSGDFARALAVDSSGNVFVTGSSVGSFFSPAPGSPGFFVYDYATIKYSGAGVPLWTNRYNGPWNSSEQDDEATALAVDGSGNVFVTGSSASIDNFFNPKNDYATIAYSGAGVPLWTNRYNGPGDYEDDATAVAVDVSGNVFVTGSSYGSDGFNRDYATIAYSGAGVPLWTNRYNGPGNAEDLAQAVAVDSDGNVFVTGYSVGSGSDYDYATIKYSGAGVPLWTNRYNAPGNSTDKANAVAVDNSGNVFVTGYSVGSGGFDDYATIKYSGGGVPLWTNRYNGPANDYSYTGRKQSLALGPDGSLYVTGGSDRDHGINTYDFTTIKYVLAPVLALERDGNGGFFINVNGVPNATYRLQRAPGVTGPWSTSAPQTAPASGLVVFWDLFPLPGQGFYRAQSY